MAVNAGKYVTQFDSCTSMLYALAHALKKKAFKGVGVVPSKFEFVPMLLNFLPFRLRQQIYRWSGGWTAIDPSMLGAVRAEEISRWVVSQYPRRRYPALFVGSSNGALIHLAAALGAPWLPQTFLLAVRRAMDPDEIEADAEWGRRHARVVLERNPELRANQMHDPVQDRLMVAQMAYFRIKRLRLGGVYRRFIRQHLAPGGTIFSLEDKLSWPVTELGERHSFQIGGLGALQPEEYLHGSPRVSAFLRSLGSARRKWPLPGPETRRPESEWGFEPAFGEDAEAFAKAHGYKFRRIRFDEPEAASPFVADLYRRWYAERKQPSDRLLVECFALVEPWVTLRAGLVPFWLAFNTEPSWEAVHSFLSDGRKFDDIHLMLMSNGVQGVGQVPIPRWKKILARARRHGDFLGLDEAKYPMDFGSFVRYHADLKKIPARAPAQQERMTLSEFERHSPPAPGLSIF